MFVDDIRPISKEKLYCDVKLVGNDDTTAAAVRCPRVLLAAQSPVMKRMLGCRGRQPTTIKFKTFSNEIIKEIGHYVNTGSILSLSKSDNDTSTAATPTGRAEDKVAHCKKLAQIKAAADHLQLTQLRRTLTLALCDAMISHSAAVTCAILNATPSEDMEIWALGRALLQTQARTVLLSKTHVGVLDLSPDTIPKVCAHVLDPMVVIDAITLWYKHGSDQAGIPSAECQNTSRLKVAKDIAQGIDLRTLTASELARMLPSEIFSTQELFCTLRDTVEMVSTSYFLSTQPPSSLLPKQKMLKQFESFYIVVGAGLKDCNGLYSSHDDNKILVAGTEYMLTFNPGGRTLVQSVVGGVATRNLYSFQKVKQNPQVFGGLSANVPVALTDVRVEGGNTLFPAPRIYLVPPASTCQLFCHDAETPKFQFGSQ